MRCTLRVLGGGPVEVEAVGVVPDEVLLLCGRPASVPSDWWAPSLVGRPDDEVDRLLADACGLLEQAGVRDAATGDLGGLLGAVADVVAAAQVLLLLETTGAGGPGVRRSVVAAPDRALLDLQAPGAGLHDLVLACPAAAPVLLCGLLAEGLVAPSSPVRGLAGPRTSADVAVVLPAAGRRSTTHVVRAGREEAVGHLVTVVHHDAGSVACWAAPDGGVLVHVLDGDDAVVDLVLALLGAVGPGVAG